jgi:predicted nucleic acid-binding protein
LTTFVVDSSIVLKWLHEEDDSERARALSRENLLAPPLLYLEVVNVAARK